MSVGSSPGSAPGPSVAAVIPVGPGDRNWHGLIGLLDRLAPTLQRRLVFARGDLKIDSVIRAHSTGSSQKDHPVWVAKLDPGSLVAVA